MPERLQDRVKRVRPATSGDDTPTSTPTKKKIRREKKPAKITEGLTINPFEYSRETSKSAVNTKEEA